MADLNTSLYNLSETATKLLGSSVGASGVSPGPQITTDLTSTVTPTSILGNGTSSLSSEVINNVTSSTLSNILDSTARKITGMAIEATKNISSSATSSTLLDASSNSSLNNSLINQTNANVSNLITTGDVASTNSTNLTSAFIDASESLLKQIFSALMDALLGSSENVTARDESIPLNETHINNNAYVRTKNGYRFPPSLFYERTENKDHGYISFIILGTIGVLILLLALCIFNPLKNPFYTKKYKKKCMKKTKSKKVISSIEVSSGNESDEEENVELNTSDDYGAQKETYVVELDDFVSDGKTNQSMEKDEENEEYGYISSGSDCDEPVTKLVVTADVHAPPREEEEEEEVLTEKVEGDEEK